MNHTAPQDADPIGDDILRAAEALLERRIGLDAQSIGSAAIARAVRARMKASGDLDATAFVRQLTHDSEACDRLIEEVVVPETWFFRDPQVFDFLKDTARGLVLAGTTPVRILCVPCASGEEPYSVAMALFDAGLSAGQFVIDAADVSRAALARAAEAKYSANAFRATDGGFRRRWFHEHGTTASPAYAVRRQVRFTRGNLLDEEFATGRDPYHLILCRNLLIYLSPAARSGAERAFDRLLGPDGLLFVGAAEPPILSRAWVPAAGHSVFALRRGRAANGGPSIGGPLPRQAGAAALVPGGDLRRPPRADTVPAAIAAGAAEPPAPTSLSPSARSHLDDLIREAGRLAHDGHVAAALQRCREHLQAAGPCPQVFYLMGMLHQSAGDLDRAEEHLQKAIYLDADHDEAFLALAVVATRRGDDALAERHRRSAGRALANKGAS